MSNSVNGQINSQESWNQLLKKHCGCGIFEIIGFIIVGIISVTIIGLVFFIIGYEIIKGVYQCYKNNDVPCVITNIILIVTFLIFPISFCVISCKHRNDRQQRQQQNINYGSITPIPIEQGV